MHGGLLEQSLHYTIRFCNMIGRFSIDSHVSCWDETLIGTHVGNENLVRRRTPYLFSAFDHPNVLCGKICGDDGENRGTEGPSYRVRVPGAVGYWGDVTEGQRVALSSGFT